MGAWHFIPRNRVSEVLGVDASQRQTFRHFERHPLIACISEALLTGVVGLSLVRANRMSVGPREIDEVVELLQQLRHRPQV